MLIFTYSQLAVVFVLGLVCGEQKNLRDKEGIVSAIKTSVMSKQYGNEDFIAGLIAEACRKYFYLCVDHSHSTVPVVNTSVRD